MRLEFHPEAERELIEAALYYEVEVPGLGKRFGREVERIAAILLARPELGHRIDSELRQFILARFPFTIIYSASSEVLRVVAISHQRRLPGYWRARL